MDVLRLLCVLLVGFLAFVHVDGALSQEQLDKTMRGLRNSCLSKVGVDEASIDGFKNGVFPEEDKVKCYASCVMKMMRMLKNGKVDVESFKKQVNVMLTPEVGSRFGVAMEKCSADGPVGANDCEVGFNFVRCMYVSDPEVFFFA